MKSKSKWQGFVESLYERQVTKHLHITFQVFWNLFLIFIVFLMMLFVFVGGVGAGFFASLVDDEPLRSQEEMRKDIYNYEETSEIYFADNIYLGEIPAEIERKEVSLEDVSQHLINAIIATEDAAFFEHKGIVPKAIARATLQELTNSSIQTGGSTLTMQLVKNQILTNELSFDRKAREIVLAMRLEKFFDKEDILEAYLNIVPFGRNANGAQIAGVQAAANGIFGVDAKDLTLPQAAYIAGLPQSPFGYTPFDVNGEIRENLEPGLERMKTVLHRMKEAGYITEAEYKEALNFDLVANLTEPSPSSIEEYPYVTNEALRRAIDIIANMLMEKDGIDIAELEGEEKVNILSRYRELANRDIRRNGYKIHTTIDKEVYDAMNEAIQDRTYVGPEVNGEEEQVGAILIENKTGAIISFVGGRDFEKQNLNHATQAYRSNGSTMKPLLAYAPAIEVGSISPGLLLPDTPHTYSGGTPFSNFDQAYQGLITARVALQRSRNIPAVRAIQSVPHEVLRDTMIKYNFLIEDGEPYESAALGRTLNDVTVEQNTNAFATFANNGEFIKSYLIQRIETHDGEIIYEHKPEPVRIFSPQTAYIMVDMLRDVLRSGGTASSLPSRLTFYADWFGKTGTSDDYHDSSFVAGNPNITMGIWIGYDTPKPIRSAAGLSYSARTQLMWASLANAAYQVRPELMAPTEKFQMPDGVVSRTICSISGLLASGLCQEAGLTTTDLFNVTYAPTKVDDSLERVKYVLLDEKPYVALESTPEEFTLDGVKIKKDYLKNVDLTKYMPENWDNLIPDRLAPNDNKAPSMVTNVRLSGNQLSWGKHHENDIVGYRIYRAGSNNTFEKIASVKGANSVSHTVNSSGSYSFYVTAVDTGGRESEPSPIVHTDSWQSTDGEDNNNGNGNDNDIIDNEPNDEEQNENGNEEPIDDILFPSNYFKISFLTKPKTAYFPFKA